MSRLTVEPQGVVGPDDVPPVRPGKGLSLKVRQDRGRQVVLDGVVSTRSRSSILRPRGDLPAGPDLRTQESEKVVTPLSTRHTHVHTHIYSTSAYVPTRTSLDGHMSVHTFICVYVYLCLRTNVRMYAHTSICTHTYVLVRTHRRTHRCTHVRTYT